MSSGALGQPRYDQRPPAVDDQILRLGTLSINWTVRPVKHSRSGVWILRTGSSACIIRQTSARLFGRGRRLTVIPRLHRPTPDSRSVPDTRRIWTGATRVLFESSSEVGLSWSRRSEVCQDLNCQRELLVERAGVSGRRAVLNTASTLSRNHAWIRSLSLRRCHSMIAGV